MLHVHTYDLELAVQTVRQIYCPHRLSFHKGTRHVDTRVDVSGPQTWPIVRLRYGAAVNVDAGDFPDLFLIMRCIGGNGTMRQASRDSAWTPGTTIPLSANLGTRFDFCQDFSQISVRPNKKRLELLCSRWLGHPLDRDLRFDLRAFSPAMERAWSSTLSLVESYGDLVHALPPAAEASLEEYVLTLLLKGHPHNFSGELETPDRRPQSRVVRRAEHYISENADRAITVSDIAAELGTSVRALQMKFKEVHNLTPATYLRKVRLDRAHEALLCADFTTSVTDVALTYGFLHLGRFSEHYKATFGESPMATLTRAKTRPRRL